MARSVVWARIFVQTPFANLAMVSLFFRLGQRASTLILATFSSEGSPSCATYVRTEGGFMVKSSLSCGETGGVIQVYPNTTPEKGNGNQATRVPAGNSASNTWPSSTQSADGVDALSPSAVSSVDQTPINESQPKTKNSNELSRGEITAIVIPIVAMIVAVIVAWWKPHQVLRALTCGYYKRQVPVRPSEVTASQNANHKQNNQGPGQGIFGQSLTINFNTPNQHHVTGRSADFTAMEQRSISAVQ